MTPNPTPRPAPAVKPTSYNLTLSSGRILTVGSLPDPAPVPSVQTKFVSPRYEPSNITQNADVLRVQAAIREAEAGNTYNLFRFYRDVVLSDDHVQSEFATRKMAVLAQPMAVLPRDKNNADDVSLAAAFLRAVDDCENWDAAMACLLDSHAGWPVSILERIYRPAGEPGPNEPRLQYTFQKFVPVNHQLECYQWAYLMGGVGLGQASAIQLANLAGAARTVPAGQVQNPSDVYTIDLQRWEPLLKLWPIDEAGRIIYDVTRADYLDPQRHVVHRGHLLDFRDNWGGPMRAILMWWLLRGLGREWFANGMERYGAPFPVGYTDAEDPAAVRLLQQAFETARKIGGLVLDEDSRVELQQAMVQGMAEGYGAFCDRCNDAISKHITGMDRAAKAKGLNAGEDNMQQTVREDYRVFDQQRLGATVVRQIVNPFRDLNGLKGSIKVIWGGLSDSDAKTFADLLVSMSQAGFEPTDDSIATVNERTGISWQRVAPKPAPEPGPIDPTDIKGMAAGVPPGLKWLSVGAAKSPVDEVAAKHTAALAAVFRGNLAPVRAIILNSQSRADAEKQLKLFFADWQPDRIAAIVEEAMQICAARGAGKGAGS